MFFEKTAQFNLAQYFDPDQDDVRVSLRELYERAKTTIAREREINLEVVLLIGCLEKCNAAVNLGIGRREDLAKSLGLTENQFWKRSQAARVLMDHPKFIDLLLNRQTHISHLAILAPKLTEANEEFFLREMVDKSEREVRELVASVNKDGTVVEAEPLIGIKLYFTKAELALLLKARESLSSTGRMPTEEQTFVTALKDLVEKRHPMHKAKRAEARAQKKATNPSAPKESCEVTDKEASEATSSEDPSLKKTPEDQTPSLFSTVPSVPKEASKGASSEGPSSRKILEDRTLKPSVKKGRTAMSRAVYHQIYLRDEGCCTYVAEDGRRCGQTKTLQIDHVQPIAHGGTDEVSNLRLLCRAHNITEALRLLGTEVMRPFYRDLPSVPFKCHRFD